MPDKNIPIMHCFQCKNLITPENNGLSINDGEFYQCNDCHLIEFGYNIMYDLLIFK